MEGQRNGVIKIRTFKEQVFHDIEAAFLNPEEFGEWHIVDGKRMLVIVDELEVIERSKRQADEGRIEGIYKKQILIYVTRGRFGELPAIGRQLKMDQSLYRVIEAANEGGIYSITLGAVKS